MSGRYRLRRRGPERNLAGGQNDDGPRAGRTCVPLSRRGWIILSLESLPLAARATAGVMGEAATSCALGVGAVGVVGTVGVLREVIVICVVGEVVRSGTRYRRIFTFNLLTFQRQK